MVVNPNSNLVFDFPDPTPRFEFNDSPSRGSPSKSGVGVGSSPSSGSAVKKGKRFGKFGRLGDKNKGNSSSSNSNSSPSSKSSLDGSSSATATTTSLNSSLNSNSLDYSLGNGNGVKASPTRLTESHSGDIAGGPSQNSSHKAGSSVGSASGSGLNFTFESSAPSTKLNLPHSGGGALPTNTTNHRRNTSAANSASGYISEVSEFSFDRVTVTTNETGFTGQSSNVSWNFMSDDVMNAVGMTTPTKQRDGSDDSKFMPYTGDTAVVLGSATANAALDKLKSNKNGKRGHAKKVSNSTFDNVSLSDDEEMDNIHFTGIVNDSSNQTVISEISERTGGPLGEESNPAVNALLREGMESARSRHRASLKGNDRSNSLMTDTAGNTTTVNNNSNDKSNKVGGKDSPSKETTETAKLTNPSDIGKSSSDSSSKDLLADLQQTYARFKTRRNNGQKEKPSILQSIIEDVQFCGLYFCGIDTTDDDKDMDYGDVMKQKKEDRKRDVDDTFLGKVIKCGNDMNCGGGSGSGAFCAAL